MNKLASFFILLILIITTLLFYFLNQRVLKEENIKMCDSMTSQNLRIMCYSFFLKDLDKCMLTGASYPFCVDFVISNIEINETFCKNLEGYPRSSCVVALALKHKNPNDCYLLNEYENRQNCYFYVSRYINFLNINEDFCKDIKEESLRFTCLAMLKNDDKICENITLEYFEKPICYAVIRKEKSYCLDSSTDKNTCLFKLALQTKNHILCYEIDSEILKPECLILLRNDKKICEEMNGSWRDYCKLNYLRLERLGFVK